MTPQPISYESLISLLDEQIEDLLPRQITDTSHPEKGGFVSPQEGMAGGAQLGCVQSLAYGWLCDSSNYHGSQEILDRLILAAGFLRSVRRPSGRYDLITTNWDCGPYTGFVIQAAATFVGAARRTTLSGASDIEEHWGEVIRSAARGMATGGFHTPNHRWVLTSALAQSQSLYPDLHLGSTIDAYLAETIDINPDGEYTERSTAVYNAICNRSLRLTAEHHDRADLLDAVRRNLDASYHLLHSDGTVVTSLSNRQDQGQRVVPVGMIDSYYTLARLDGNGFYASIADWLASFRREARWALEPFIAHPEWREDNLERAPLPTSYSHWMPVSGVWRVRRHNTSVTIAKGISTPVSVRRGEIEVGIKVCATYFARAQFKADRLEETTNGARLVYEGGRHKPPGYYHPVNREVTMEDYSAVMLERDFTAYARLEMTLDVEEVGNRFDLRLRTSEPFDNIPLEILFVLSPGGTLHSDSLVAEGIAGQTAFLSDGFATYHIGNDAISFGPGSNRHRMRDMRGSEPEPTAFRVLTTYRSPVDQTIQVRAGTWSEATESICYDGSNE